MVNERPVRILLECILVAKVPVPKPLKTKNDISRVKTSDLFPNFLADPEESEFLATELNELMTLDWHVKGKYGPLCCLVDILGSSTLLKHTSNLPLLLLDSLSEQTLACYVRILFFFIFAKFATCN